MSTIDFPTFLILWNKLQRQGTPDVHLRLALWLGQRWEAGDKRLLIMAFRSLGKSTIVGVFCTWLLWGNPDLRILVLAADLALAKKMVRNVKRIIEKHPMTAHLRPERADQWGSDRFTLRRQKELRDPSMLAKGITTNLTGSRADLIICDDVEVEKTCDTDHKRSELRERLAELDYVLTPDGTQLYIGTPHTWDTIYADEKRVGEDEIFLQGFERIVIPVMDMQGNSAWPERFPLDVIEQKRLKTGPGKFASQMLCQPVNITDGKFDPASLTVYDDDVVYSESQQQPVLTIDGKKMVAACAWWDPSFGRQGGDKSVFALIYTDEHGRFWLHHLQAILTKPDSVVSEAEQQCRIVCDLLENYFVPLIAVETNGIGMFLPGMLKNMLGEMGNGCSVLNITSRRPKNVRISEAFEVVLAARTLNVHRTALANSFLQELKDWSPKKKHQADDALDAVAGALTLSPHRIMRSFGGKKQNWMVTGKIRMAKTVLD